MSLVSINKITQGEDISLVEFLSGYARDLGALAHMRDEKQGAPIKYREVDTERHEKRIAEAEKNYHYYMNMTEEQAEELVNEDHDYFMRMYKEKLEENELVKPRIQAMIDKVSAWEPPTEKHNNLKNIAVTQLQDNLAWYVREPTEPEKEDAAEWLLNMRENAERVLDNFKEEYKKHVDYVAKVNKWIDDFAQSLGIEIHS